jgi:hypothetical protein
MKQLFKMLQRPLLSLLIGFLCWQPVCWLPLAAQAEIIRVEFPAQIEPDRSDLWMNASYALGGSALSNSLVMVTIAGLGLALSAYNTNAPPLLDIVGPSSLYLLLITATATPLLMHLWSPEAESQYFMGSLSGSLIMTVAQALLMIPLILLFNKGNISDTYWALLPSAFITSVLFQALGAAWGHEFAQNWDLAALPGQGLQLTYRVSF